MGILDRLRSGNSPSRDIALRAATPTPNITPDPKPLRGASGRGHTAGFLDLEEWNSDLKHPEGAKIYDQMYRGDGDVRQVVKLVTNPVSGGTWAVEPYGGEEADATAAEHAEFVTWALWEQMSPDLIGHLIEFLPVLVRSGFVPGEKLLKSVKYKGETKLVYDTIALRLPRTVWIWEQDESGKLRRIKQYLPTSQKDLSSREGAVGTGRGSGDTEIWMDREDLVYYRIEGEGDNWEGVSMLRPAYKHWLMKDRIERIDAIAQEREALGVPIAYPPMGATDDQLDEVEDILAGMRTNEESYIVAPGPKAGSGLSAEGTGWLFEVIGYDRTGSGRDPQPSLQYHTQKIAAAFISEFMRLGHGESGARATAQVQADPFLMSVEAFVTIVERVLNEDIVRPLIRMNYAGVENFPKLKMSLVDSTSLAQLADFVLKLTQIGALMPDQELEDFLRARADLPPANPESVKKRKADDDELRRQIVTGAPGGGGDTYGQNDKPGKPHGTKDAPGSNAGATGGINRGTKDGQRSSDYDDSITLSSYDPVSDRYRPRQRRYNELWVDLDNIEDKMDNTGDQLVGACREHLVGDVDKEKLTEAVHKQLSDLYNYGYQTVLDEANAQRPDLMPDPMLSRGARDESGALSKRATSVADKVTAEMQDHYVGHQMAHGSNGRALIASERAGVAALKAAGHNHGVAAILHGRSDAGKYLSSDESPYQVVKVHYSAILDRSTCEHCRSADDGVARSLDDPVRLHREPPNPDCLSTHSGHNRCRCFETYELAPTGMELASVNLSTSPDIIQNIANALKEHGYRATDDRVHGVAMQIARHYCKTGRTGWPGLPFVGTREEACAVIR